MYILPANLATSSIGNIATASPQLIIDSDVYYALVSGYISCRFGEYFVYVS